MNVQHVYATVSIKQVAASIFFPRLCSHSCIESTIIGGWSLGGVFSFHSGLELESCYGDPLAVFSFECRVLRPQPRWNHAREMPLRYSHATTNLHFAEVSNRQCCTPSLCFMNPPWEDNDPTTSTGIVIPNGLASDCVCFPDATHMTIGLHHYWDIARRVRCCIGCVRPRSVLAATLLYETGQQPQRLIFKERQVKDGVSRNETLQKKASNFAKEGCEFRVKWQWPNMLPPPPLL